MCTMIQDANGTWSEFRTLWRGRHGFSLANVMATPELIEPSDTLIISSTRADIAAGRARQVRERARLSQAEVARALGVDTATVSRWETGMRLPRGRTALRLASLLAALERQLQKDG